MASVFAELLWLGLRVFTRRHVRWRLPSVRMFDHDALCKHIHTSWVMLVHHSFSPKHPCNAWMPSVDQYLLILILSGHTPAYFFLSSMSLAVAPVTTKSWPCVTLEIMLPLGWNKFFELCPNVWFHCLRCFSVHVLSSRIRCLLRRYGNRTSTSLCVDNVEVCGRYIDVLRSKSLPRILLHLTVSLSNPPMESS